MPSDNFEALLQNGVQAAQAGNKAAAKQMFVQALKLNPHSEIGWMWMVQVVETDKEREFCLQKILEINPTNAKAQQALQALRQPPVPDWTQQPPPPPPQQQPPPPPAPTPEDLEMPTTGELDFDWPEAGPDDLFGAPGTEEEMDWLGTPTESDLEPEPPPPEPAPSPEPPQPAESLPVGDDLGLDWPEPAGDSLGVEWPEDAATDQPAEGASVAAEDDWAAEEADWGDWPAPAFEGDEGDTLDALREEAEEDGEKKPKRRGGLLRALVRVLLLLVLLAVVIGAVFVAMQVFVLPQFRIGGEEAPPPTETEMAHYQGPAFRLDYPQHWQVIEETETMVRVGDAEDMADKAASATINLFPEESQTAAEMLDVWRAGLDEVLEMGESAVFEAREQGEVAVGQMEGQFMVLSVEPPEAEEAESALYIYGAVVVGAEQALSMEVISPDEADMEAAKQMLASLTLDMPAEAPSEATEMPEATEEAEPTEVMEEAEPTATEPTLAEGTEEAAAGQTYESDLFTLIYPEDWVDMGAEQEGDDRVEVTFSRGQIAFGPLPEDFALAKLTVGPAGENDSDVMVELLRAAALAYVNEQDGTELEAEAIEQIDLGSVTVSGQDGAYEFFAIDRPNSTRIYVYTAAAILDIDQMFTLVLYSTHEADREIAESMLKSLDVPESMPAGPTPEYGPPPPPAGG